MKLYLDPAKDESTAANPPVGEVKVVGESKTIAEPKPAVKEVNLSEKVKINGQDYTVAELAARVQQSVDFEGSVYKVLSGNEPAQSKAESMRAVLTHYGETPEAIEAYIQEHFPEKATQESNESLDGGNERLNAIEADIKRQKIEILNDTLESQVTRLLDSNKDVANYIEAANRAGGEKQVEKARAVIGKQLRKATIEAMHLKKAQTGKSATKEWIPELMGQVVSDVLENVGGAVIGDPNKIGRSTETDTGIVDFVGTKEPVRAPEYKPGMGRSAVDKEMSDWLLDGMVRDVAKVASAGTSRV